MFCGRVASSATVCTKATLSFWYFSNTWSTARVDAIVLDPNEAERVRDNPRHRRVQAMTDRDARGMDCFHFQKRGNREGSRIAHFALDF